MPLAQSRVDSLSDGGVDVAGRNTCSLRYISWNVANEVDVLLCSRDPAQELRDPFSGVS